MFKDVVKPLEQDLENAGFKSSSEPSTESGGPGDLGDSGMNTRAINSIQLRSEPISRKNSSVHLAEAGVSNSTAAATASQESAITDKWMLDFSGIADSRTSRNAPIIKIAVLDTGIDREHQDFLDDERIKDWQSWTGSPADTDSNGHGTHVVSTLLQLAGQNVEIYVAKISDDIKLHSGQADKIAEAIDHSTQTWDVDIISMSFGFGEKFESIQKAIDRAVDTQKIVFAAASNEGANRTRTFPATHPRVICVHSADGYGNPSKFNPTALQWKHNFCVLGEHIEAACPRSNEDDFGGVKRESGTSFATPVGVAIAAFLICYVAEKRPDSKSWKTPVKSPDGVMAMFEEMSENRGVGLYSSINIINVFNDSAAGEEEFLAKIRKRLEKR
ncbi:peptidase S8/S53 domain-containing protein [Cladorrhinum sp. PSN332]|nr:peptidase S8/S53 domain-containing protein [Cladorrhinum sp. PSN332]